MVVAYLIIIIYFNWDIFNEMHLYLSIAGIIIKVQYNYNKTYRFVNKYTIDSKEYISPSLYINLSREKILKSISDNRAFFGDSYIKSQNHSYVPYYTEMNFEANALYIEIAESMPDFSTFLMHGAVVAKDGEAYMFAAPSGVGKTTRAKLWIDKFSDSIIVNGDKPFIKISNGEVLACGTPWCGKEGWNTNIMVPLKAIFFIERSDHDVLLEELSFGKAFPLLIQQTYHPYNNKSLERTLLLLKEMDGKVKFYRFKSTPTIEAIDILHKIVKN